MQPRDFEEYQNRLDHEEADPVMGEPLSQKAPLNMEHVLYNEPGHQFGIVGLGAFYVERPQ